MIERIEHLAVRLIPYRKWIIVAFLVAFIGVMPAAFGLAVLFKKFWIYPIGMFLTIFGFTWTSGLFLISYWYNPDGGPLTLKKINASHPGVQWYGYFMRYSAPVALVILFLMPLVYLAMLYPFMRY